MDPGGNPQEHLLSAAFETRQPDHLALAHGDAAVDQPRPAARAGDALHEHDLGPGGRGTTRQRRGRVAEHHLQQAFGIEGAPHLPGHPAQAQDTDPVAEGFHILELVGHQQHAATLRRQAPQGRGEHLLLRDGNARRGLIEDQHPDPQRQQTHQLELLPFPHGKTTDRRIGVQVEMK